MAGVVAGSASKEVPREMEYGTHTLVMTMNNLCNLECAHCYLQYDSENSFMTPELVDAIVNSSVKHIVIAGKEPFVNDKSAGITAGIIEGAHSTGKTVSVISNGINIPKYLTETFPKPDFMDVSVDGGPESYRITRHNRTGKDFYQTALAGARRILDLDIPLTTLHTVHSKNIKHLDDLMIPILELNPRFALFSPYRLSQNDGQNYVDCLSVDEVMNSFSKSQKFMNHPNSYLFLDKFVSPIIGESEGEELSKKYGLDGKIMIATPEQLAQIMRLTYDGFITTPQDSINPSLYTEVGYRFNPKKENFDDALEKIRAKNEISLFSDSLTKNQLNQSGG